MILPTFMVVGTQKAATTWLYECLNEHPEVFVPETKELHYFCRAEDCRLSNRHRGDAWYERQFSSAKGMPAVGELTTDYMLLAYVAEKLMKLMAEFDLNFGAVDFRLTPDGEHVFLEVNPAGEYLFASERSGQPVPQAIAATLDSHAKP